MINKNVINILLIFVLFVSACSSDEPEQQNQNSILSVKEKEFYETDIDTLEASAEESTTIQETIKYNDYDVELNIEPEEGKVIGKQTVCFRNKSKDDFEEVYFNVYLNAFSKDCSYTPYFKEFRPKIIDYGRLEYGKINIESVSVGDIKLDYNIEETIMKVNLNETLKSGETTEISMTFSADIPRINARTGRNNQALWFGNFLPILAVYDNKGWHTDPYYPAGDPFYSNMSNYSVKITTPIDYIVVATGEEISTESDDQRHTSIKTKVVRDFAFAISNQYEVKRIKTESDIYISLYYYSNLENADLLLKESVKAVDFFNSTLGVYPYSSIDIVETGLFSSIGMEYPQVIFMDSTLLNSENVQDTIGHEIGHQWFYNVVGSDQVNEAWLDEGLIHMLQKRINMDENQIERKAMEDYASLQVKLDSFEYKKLSDPISVYTSWNNYYNIHYIKANLMLYSLEKYIGREVFDEFIKTYYNKYAFQVASVDDFIGTAKEISPIELDKFFDDWINGESMPSLFN